MRIKGKVTADESAVTVHYRPATSYVIECFRVMSDSVATLMAPMRKGADGLTNKAARTLRRRQKMWCEEARRGEFPPQPRTSRSVLIMSDRRRPAPAVTLRLTKCIISSANLPVLYLDCAHLSMPGIPPPRLRGPSLTPTFNHFRYG